MDIDEVERHISTIRLVCVNEKTNTDKSWTASLYKIPATATYKIICRWGRRGATEQRKDFFFARGSQAMSFLNSKLEEKRRKGYVGENALPFVKQQRLDRAEAARKAWETRRRKEGDEKRRRVEETRRMVEELAAKKPTRRLQRFPAEKPKSPSVVLGAVRRVKLD